MTQLQLAKILDANQGEVSKIERRSDIYSGHIEGSAISQPSEVFPSRLPGGKSELMPCGFCETASRLCD